MKISSFYYLYSRTMKTKNSRQIATRLGWQGSNVQHRGWTNGGLCGVLTLYTGVSAERNTLLQDKHNYTEYAESWQYHHTHKVQQQQSPFSFNFQIRHSKELQLPLCSQPSIMAWVWRRNWPFKWAQSTSLKGTISLVISTNGILNSICLYLMFTQH
jgi:hypothetical protein